MVARSRKSRNRIGAAAGLLALLLPAAARAQCALLCEDSPPIWLALVALLAPEVGVAAKTNQTPDAHFALSWSGQLPLDRGLRHRMVPSVDLLPLSQSGARWRLRVGYRYGWRHVFAGAGFSGNTSEASLSPELGVKFAHMTRSAEPADPSMHLLARGEIAPESGHVRGVTVLLGWNFF